jgi:hypothetical protein
MRPWIPAFLVISLCGAACGGGGSAVPDIDAAPEGDTWANYAMGFATDYCTVCHMPGGQGYRNGDLDFRTIDDVVTNAAEIRCGVAPTQLDGCTGFPPPAQFPIAAPYPSDAERLRFVAWIEAGTLP